MKKYITLFAAAFLALGATAQNFVTITTANGERKSFAISDVKEITLTDDDESRTLHILTFENGSSMPTNAAGDEVNWSDLIDSAEYGGPQLYGKAYSWWDPKTDLFAEVFESSGYNYWNGGIAISNYTSTTLEGMDYLRQLSAYVKNEGDKGGHNGSENFAVANIATWTGTPAALEMPSKPAIIDHCYINLGAYGIAYALYGDGFGSKATEKSHVDLIAKGYDENGNLTGSATIALIDGTNIMQEWTYFSLANLGKVSKVTFDIVDVAGDLSGDWGINFPTYFLLDDIAVLTE